MRFRDEISGKFLSLEVALSNPDLVIPLDKNGRKSPEAAIEWARIVTKIIVEARPRKGIREILAERPTGEEFEDDEDREREVEVGAEGEGEGWNVDYYDDLEWGGEEDLGEEDMY